ncbi:hypothetical protein CLV92_101261 [Kineococcus xinjiangensis]|uniref:Uncharacterized protein n=1 Tax=Kineococcus xinjiangensis TaxID=512762 RepID=A0A2S6IWA0_9ACTN|nr:hypothetical protein [Kineococcus xinjiangensis]PPK98565.1 hypothetical protein CLV92_101261 [Kineococcus xinjiangensis]
MSKWTYAADFAKGLLAGDLWREDSLAWLAGNLASGGASVIPVVGWIAGAVADVRDAIGSAIHADWVGSGLSALGVVPYAGDAVAIPGKTARFVQRNLDKSDEVLRFVAELDDVPTAVKVETSKLILKDRWDVLRDEGFSDATILALKSGRGSIDQVLETVGRATRTVRGSGFKATGSAGVQALEAAFGASTKGVDKQVWFSSKTFLGRGRRGRLRQRHRPRVQGRFRAVLDVDPEPDQEGRPPRGERSDPRRPLALLRQLGIGLARSRSPGDRCAGAERHPVHGAHPVIIRG